MAELEGNLVYVALLTQGRESKSNTQVDNTILHW